MSPHQVRDTGFLARREPDDLVRGFLVGFAFDRGDCFATSALVEGAV